ncbi:DUF421 domain-containing protein [Candidatus Formimonas warabiya]|uniref:YetF C-terminal domain-containing protein n=1 Tax=Formimonas warabiya TaxID=1761012 RepID=A0A3G1KS40_FORW1|nr:DUF421 domain-containing protein [Candidatus Formimonas warabiya]ATW25217.1 hypothetical protein DCMF_10960 [Candidatus Formimonas warabiya]
MADWIETALRTGLLFFIVWLLVRLKGKRNMVEIPPFQFISFLVIGVTTALIASGIIPNLFLGLITLGIWVSLFILMDYAAMKSKWVHDWVYGRETVLISHGKVLEENLTKVRITGEELLRSLRTKNVFSLSDVEFALMENTGEINVLLKSDQRPLVPKDFGRKIPPGTAPQTVILDGNMLHEPLTRIGLNQEWLKTELKKVGVSLENVFIGQVDTFGELYLDLFDDTIQLAQPKVRDLLYANLEKCQSDLMSFALETENSTAKEMYLKNSRKVKEIKDKLEPYLLR